MITFLHDVPLADQGVFEDVYEEELQQDDDDKVAILKEAGRLAVWLELDGQLVGETYGLTPAGLYRAIEEQIEDCDPADDRSIYCYSTTILPEFQGRGLAQLLKSYWLGLIAGRGPSQRVVGHATSPEMIAINAKFGAVLSTVHERWYDTDRTAVFYELRLR